MLLSKPKINHPTNQSTTSYQISWHCRTNTYAHSVAKSWIFQISNSFPVNAATKYVCGVGTAFARQNQDCALLVARPTEMIHMSLVLSMFKKSSKRTRKKKRRPSENESDNDNNRTAAICLRYRQA